MRHFYLVCFVFVFVTSQVFAWRGRSLECWQCAAIPDSSTKCPKDATLYRMTNWDACMTWTLKWENKVVLQNFVRADVDCTKSRLKFWSEYIEQVWKEPGKARCCYSNKCNDGILDDDDDDDEFVPLHAQIPTSRPTETTTTTETLPTTISFSTTTEPEGTSLSDESFIITSSPINVLPEVAALEADIQGSVEIDECRKCFSIANAVCESNDLFNRVDVGAFNKHRTAIPECRCRTGFIPIYERGADGLRTLNNCHDPIIVTSTVGGRCLIPEHCDHLENTACKEDSRIPNYMSCQCKVGFVQMSVASDSPAMICEPAKKSGGCSSTGDCMEVMHAHCNSETDKCECAPGFIESFSESKLSECQDPIVLTSTVNGYCLVDEHCRNLEGTFCSTASDQGQFKRCKCIEGYNPVQPHPITGIIEKCVKENTANEVLNVISQGLFGDTIVKQPETFETQALHKFPTNASGLEFCGRQITVVESNEWVPNEHFAMSYDNITDAWIAVFFAKIPSSALPTHGVLIRFMSGIPDLQDKLMYTITLYKNRQMSILKSFLDSSGNQKEVVQVVQISDSFKWLSSLTYTGFWVVFKQGYIALGVVYENTVDSPLMTWSDPHVAYDITEIGLSTVGAAVLYGVDCGLDPGLFYPEGTCRLDDSDCDSIPNTRCLKPAVPPGPLVISNDNGTSAEKITFPSCQCKEGFEPIPEPLRAIERGCYDPIFETLTVNSRCISDRHCQKLKNTECKSSIFDESVKTCRCIRGTLPSAPDSLTGLVLGCEESVRAELLSISSCKMRFSIKERKDWIPQTIVKMPYSSRRNSYSMAFYVRLDPSISSPGSTKNANRPETIVSIKLLDAKKSQDKIYKVTLSSNGAISIYENIRGATFLFGNFFREGLLIKTDVLALNEIASSEFAGFWVRYQNLGDLAGTISLGRIGSEAPLQQYRDTSTNALSDTAYIGFEVEQGSTIEFGALCFEE